MSAVEPPTRAAFLDDINLDVLARLTRLDLSDAPDLRHGNVVNAGAYGDVFKCRCKVNDREIDVAAKRLRFYVKSQDFKSVRILVNYTFANILPRILGV